MPDLSEKDKQRIDHTSHPETVKGDVQPAAPDHKPHTETTLTALAQEVDAPESKPKRVFIANKADAHGFFSDLSHALSKKDRSWGDVSLAIRLNTPDVVINQSGRITFGLQVAANALGIYGAKRFYNYGGRAAYKQAALIRANWTSLMTNSLGVLFAEKPMTVEERKNYENMSWVEFFPNRLLRGLAFWEHPESALSLGMMYNGIETYRGSPNILMASKGLLTTAGGAALNLDPDRERAWKNSTSIFFLQKMFSITNAWQAYFTGFASKSGDPRDALAAGNWSDGVKLMINQISNVVGNLYGGVYVDENGNLFKEIKADGKPNVPSTEDIVLEARTEAPIDVNNPLVLSTRERPTGKGLRDALDSAVEQVEAAREHLRARPQHTVASGDVHRGRLIDMTQQVVAAS